MQIILEKEFEKLPAWQINMAVLHAQSYVEDHLGLDENDKNYYKQLQKHANHYLKEGIEESLTPHMMKNPTTPIVEDAFLLQPFFSIDSTFFTEYVKDQDQKEKFYRLLKSSVNTLALVYIGAAMKLKKSDFAFPKGASKAITRQRIVDRYKRAFFVTSIMAMLEPLFRTNPKSLDKFIEQKLAAYGDEISKPEFREGFIKRLRDQIVKEGFNEQSLNKIL